MNTQQNSFSNVNGIVAVDGHVPSAGMIIWWRLSGRVDFDTFRDAWLAAGLAEADVPAACTPTNALRRAVDDLREKRVLVRPLGRDAGFAIVKERLTGEPGDELSHGVLAKVSLNLIGKVVVEQGKAGSQDQVQRIREQVEASFEQHLSTLDAADFSTWLVRMMPRLDAVGLRDQGGIYFVPPHATQRVTDAVAVLRTVTSHVVNRVPAMRSEEAVDAILDAVQEEAQAEAAQLEKAIEAGTLGERGFENRVQRCEQMDAKIERYEELLGRKLDTLRERLEGIRANLTVAALKAASKEDVA